MLTYYDPITKRQRLKRRYLWALGAFLAGTALGFVVARLL
jgi:hypothetical protein